MSLLTREIRQQLIANGKSHGYDQNKQINNVPPVCFIYDEHSSMCWLLTEIDRTMPGVAWGIIDCGDGKPDFQSFSLRVLEDSHEQVARHDGLMTTTGTQCLKDWEAQGMLSNYIAAAAQAGRIVELDGKPLAPERRHAVRALHDHTDAELDALIASQPQAKASLINTVGWMIKSRALGLFRRNH